MSLHHPRVANSAAAHASPTRHSTSAGFVYPTYASYKAIKSNDMQKLEVWLMYWVVMGTVMAMESTVEWIFAW